MRVFIKKESNNSSLKNSKLIRGDTENIIVRLNGQGLLIDNFEFKFTCKVNESDSDGDALIQKSSGSGITLTQVSNTVIEAKIAIDSADTEPLLDKDKLFYDIQMKMLSPLSVRTLEKGVFEIEADITQDNS